MHYIHRPCSQLNIDESIEAKRFNQTEAIREAALKRVEEIERSSRQRVTGFVLLDFIS